MATVDYYLDTRSIKKNGKAPLKLSVSIAKNQKVLIPMNIDLLPAEWADGYIIRRTDRATLQSILDSYLVSAETEVIRMTLSGEIYNLPPKTLRAKISSSFCRATAKPTLVELFERIIDEKTKEKTKKVYINTKNKIVEFCGRETQIIDVNKVFLKGFEAFLLKQGLRINSVNLHLRNLRAIYNEAIDLKYVSVDDYPFRKFAIKKEETKKRNISIEKIRQIYNYDSFSPLKKYADIFMLMFFFRGINMVDLCYLDKVANDGYIEYRRSKTSGLIRIKVEPEMLKIINKYKGKKYLLNIVDSIKDYSYFTRLLNRKLRLLVDEKGQQICDSLSTYYTRHSWATIAASKDMGLSKDIIAAALGHKPRTVTDIYIEYDSTIIDDANRKMIDWVLYGKK